MSYYPSLDGNVPTYTSTASGAIPTASGPANANHADPSFAPEPPLASLSSSKKRKPSKSKSAKQLSRSVSTPQLFGSSIMSDFDDKKRNKLGYQRISIACDGDPHQRCQNCIRLKKECVFYPVDQQSALEGKPEGTNKPEAGSNASSVVSSSSPNSGSERVLEQTHNYSSLPSLPSNASSSFSRLPMEPGSALPTQGSFVQQGYGYNREEETRQGWNSPERYGQHHHAALPPVANISPQDPWSYGQQGAAGDYAPFPVNAPTVSQSPQTTSPFAFSAQRNDSFWTPHQHQHQHQQHQQPPMRSMSYGNIEHLHTGNPSFSSTYSTPAEAVRYPPPPLEYANTTMMLQQPAPQAAPVVPPPLPPPSQSFAQQPHPYMFQQEPASSSAAGPPGHAYPGSWMAAPPSFAPLQEPPESYGRRQQGHE